MGDGKRSTDAAGRLRTGRLRNARLSTGHGEKGFSLLRRAALRPLPRWRRLQERAGVARRRSVGLSEPGCRDSHRAESGASERFRLLSMRLIPLRQVDARRTEILNGRRGISPDTALRLSRYLGPSAAFWLNLQSQYDLARTADEKRSPFRARLRSGPQPVGDAAGVSGADLANLHMSREWNSRALRSRTRRS